LAPPAIGIVRSLANGVQLFFAISGFILAIPFASAAFRGTPTPTTKSYMLRRITRLEPPFALAMTLIALMLILLGKQRPTEVAKHLAATLLYCHAIVFETRSTISFVTWSLEVEVQFYLLMPLLAQVYRISGNFVRRTLLATAAMSFVLFQQLAMPSLSGAAQNRISLSLIGHFQYFIFGMLLADLYVKSGNGFNSKNSGWDYVSLIGWPTLMIAWQFPSVSALVFPPAIVVLYIAAFKGPVTNRIAINPWISIVGGMCYTIYLLHLQLISLLGPFFRKIIVHDSFAITYVSQALLIGVPLLTLCSLYFVFVEKPCMDSRWPQKLRAWAAGATP
jgi:peptidoglycan/LPS O-acetylase OafA/YrhL